MENYRLAKHLHVSEVTNGIIGLYSAYFHGIGYLPIEIYQKLLIREFEDVDHSIIQYLIDKRILVTEEFEREFFINNKPTTNVAISTLFLITTTECNLRCKYCVVLGTEEDDSSVPPSSNMSIDAARNALMAFRHQVSLSGAKVCRITFYGGEPMLNVGLIKTLVPEIRQMEFQCKVEIVIITNGYAFDKNLIPILQEHNVGVCVSIDGSANHHDQVRVTTAKNKPTHARATDSFRKYKEASLSVGISCTIGTHNCQDLEEIQQYFSNVVGAKFIEFQVPYIPSKGENAFYVDIAEVANRLFSAYESAFNAGVTEGTVHRKVADLLSGTVRFNDCGAIGSQMVALPDGRIGPCHSLATTGTYFAEFSQSDIDPKGIFQEWAKRSPFNMPECKDCPYISICGGGCPYNALMSNGDIWAKDPQACSFNAKLINWYLQWVWRTWVVTDFKTTITSLNNYVEQTSDQQRFTC